ncbi:MAG: D-2-hydroxyacid dehydrogenase family protein [Candidatus Lambdaproteobacteria bacterium]|nr:D-2-hydroxyacid dehydrogenase family protein [Candidatus Lambdaproteobacteria bacterium]
MINVALLDDYQDVALKLAPWGTLPAGVSVQAFHQRLADEDAAVERLRTFDVVMALRERTPFPRSLLERLPRLKLLTSAGKRNKVIDVGACTELGILVCGTTSSGGPTVEFTWGLILALLRHIPEEVNATRAGRWQTTMGTELAGKTLGLLGLGGIGSRVAEVARAFRMTLLAWSPHMTAERAQACGAAYVPLERLLRESDLVTIHLVLGPATQGLLRAPELALMKKTAYLVNTSRGPIVDEGALLAALRGKAIAGAALDVFDQEPLPPDHPFRALDNALITPHLGGVTIEHRAGYYIETLENIRAFLDEAPIRVWNPDVLPRRRKV